MKKIFLYSCLKAFCLFLVLNAFVSCDDLESIVPNSNGTINGSIGGLYILCDGNYSLNNSTLALYDFKKNSLNTDFFQSKSGRKLGDTGNDMQRYGSKLYVVVNVSSQLEVLDARTGKVLRQIPFMDGTKARQPRTVTFWEDKAYVCSFDGTVAKIDTTTLDVEAYVKVGRNPDGITASNGKLYVSNSGGLDYANPEGYENTVSVIDAATFTVTKNVTVGTNPGKIKADIYGYVYVATRGDYKSEQGVWQCIDTNTDEVVKTIHLTVTNFDFYGNLAYIYSYDNTSKESWIKVFDLEIGRIVKESFIQDGTSIATPYGINVNPNNGDVYITDAGNYVSLGDVCCFGPNGVLKYQIANVGVSPNTVLQVADLSLTDSESVDPAVLEAKYLYKVLDYTPAPGQFVGKYPLLAENETIESMRAKAEQQLKGLPKGIVSLGRFGGSLTFAFKSAVQNGASRTDFRIFGNAFANSAEPGIVEVSVDENRNGLTDDAWYELAGSEYSNPSTLKKYSITYRKPSSKADSVFYRDNQGKTGYVNAFYPSWQGDSIVCRGTLLAPTAVKNSAGYWALKNLAWGYVDNQPNDSEFSCFDIDWAVNAVGESVKLDAIDFIRVYTVVNQNAGWVGEISTEVCGAEVLSY